MQIPPSDQLKIFSLLPYYVDDRWQFCTEISDASTCYDDSHQLTDWPIRRDLQCNVTENSWVEFTSIRRENRPNLSRLESGKSHLNKWINYMKLVVFINHCQWHLRSSGFVARDYLLCLMLVSNSWGLQDTARKSGRPCSMAMQYTFIVGPTTEELDNAKSPSHS